jgi:hypothetical protein
LDRTKLLVPVSNQVSPPTEVPGTPTVKFRIAVDPLIDHVTIFVLSSARALEATPSSAAAATVAAKRTIFFCR